MNFDRMKRKGNGRLESAAHQPLHHPIGSSLTHSGHPPCCIPTFAARICGKASPISNEQARTDQAISIRSPTVSTLCSSESLLIGHRVCTVRPSKRLQKAALSDPGPSYVRNFRGWGPVDCHMHQAFSILERIENRPHRTRQQAPKFTFATVHKNG